MKIDFMFSGHCCTFHLLALNRLTIIATTFWDVNRTTEFTVTNSGLHPESLLIMAE